jgi:hypothetical protein
LGIFPVDPSALPPFRDWEKIHGLLKEVNDQILNMTDGLQRKPVLERLLQNRDTLSPDPFLQTFYWEKILRLQVWEAVFHPEDESVTDVSLKDSLDEWGRKGYHTAGYERRKSLWLSAMGKKDKTP